MTDCASEPFAGHRRGDRYRKRRDDCFTLVIDGETVAVVPRTATRKVHRYKAYAVHTRGLASRRSLLEQLAELDLRRPFGLTGLPQADLPTRQRISPGVDTYAEQAAGELLNVTACVALAMTAR